MKADQDRVQKDQQDGYVRLRAVVRVDPAQRVQCQQLGCGHTVYAAIHVVDVDGKLLVLGSDCFTKRFGLVAMDRPQFSSGGSGRKLTDAERLLLLSNTEVLLQQFEAEVQAQEEAARLVGEQQQAQEQQQRQESIEKLKLLRTVSAERQQALSRPVLSPQPSSPWPWRKAGSSVGLFTAPGGRSWIRVQHSDESHKLVPWPIFDGWEYALPAAFPGLPDLEIGAFSTTNMVQALNTLRQLGFKDVRRGRWYDVIPR